MADHGENYVRLLGKDKEEIGVLNAECGHHCGAITVGNATPHIRHCGCAECHGTNIKVDDEKENDE